MAVMTLEVVRQGADPIQVRITPKVIVQAERQFKMGMSRLFGSDASLEHMTWCAWKGMQLSGHEVKTYDLWLDDIDDVRVADEDDALPLPTP